MCAEIAQIGFGRKHDFMIQSLLTSRVERKKCHFEGLRISFVFSFRQRAGSPVQTLRHIEQ
jgi:hypothetical protein